MQAVLYVGHGSRRKEAVEESIQFMREAMKTVVVPIQEYCFLELSNPDIMRGVKQCVLRGATRIAVIPLLLLSASHAKKDIPQVLERASRVYPEVTFTYGGPLGVHRMMVDVLVDKIKEKKKITGDMDILLVGRGSSDRNAVRDIQMIARLLDERLNVRSIECCFLAAATPHFETKAKDFVDNGPANLLIIPYLLFIGTLVTHIKEFVNDLQLRNDQQVVLCDYLRGHPNLFRLLSVRVDEAVKSERYFLNHIG
ncbi:sirohydrochlorin chelatase [Halobacillus ihumii]|uniref:sirohydrochlorin chelatase n=1 Tax=Halobacillus ihumii TaxID=2686092 RepID=UPI0013CFB078|nr:sirohydrochlorin chelatase [Halobacillus ihumii]